MAGTVASGAGKPTGNLTFGGEYHILLTNFTQPGFPGGNFYFSRNRTAQSVYNPDASEGSSIASLLLDFGSGGGLNIQPGTATRSTEHAFFVQDDWKISKKLTLNLGPRYEWSAPFTERYNREEVSNFTGATNVTVPGVGPIRGYSIFEGQPGYSPGSDYNNVRRDLDLLTRLHQEQ